MTIIDISDDGFTINGTSSKVVTTSLAKAGLSSNAIAEIVGGWFVGVTGSTTPAPFSFATDVEKSDPTCLVDYDRRFSHAPWIDGESRVQAGMTPEELGFNARFQSLENEFDAIADQFKRVGGCVANLRGDVFGVAEELEAKLTTMQNEIHALQQATKPVKGPLILGTATVEGKDTFVTQFGDDFKFVEFQQQPIKGVDDIRPRPPIDFDPVRVQPRALVDLVGEIDEAVRQPVFDPLFDPDGTTVREMRRSGADVVLPSGVTLSAVMADLPAETRLADRGAAVDAILTGVIATLPADRARELRGAVLADEAVERRGGALLNSGVGAVVGDAQTAELLSRAGFGTVGRLAGATPGEVSAAVSALGATIDPAAAKAAVGRAVIGRAVRDIGVG